MRIWLLPLLLATMATTCVAQSLPLWPSGAPGETGDIGAEHDTTPPNGGLAGGKRVIRLSNVTNPTITLYRPSKRRDTGAAVVVCPGGGYQILAMDLEGTEVCAWLNSIGVTAVLLKYRVPERKGLGRYVPPLQDAQRTLGLVRMHAKEWHLDPHRVGIMGFSAGGHLSAVTSTHFGSRTYPLIDEADTLSCRPDFALLIYPGYLAIKEQGDKLAPELTVSTNTPPTFLIQTQDDPIPVENSLVYYLALKNAGVPVEMHLFPKGGHGYGLRPSDQTVVTWPKRAEEWMRASGILKKP